MTSVCLLISAVSEQLLSPRVSLLVLNRYSECRLSLSVVPDKTNAPQPVSVNFATRKSLGGNDHENWTLLRLLPLMVGPKIPEGGPAWEVLLVLKNIVELVVNQVHTEKTICFLDIKISEHKHRFLMLFFLMPNPKTPFHGTLSRTDQGLWSSGVTLDNAF